MLAISAHVDDKVKDDIINCGFSDVLTVPLKLSEIRDEIVPKLEKREELMLEKVELSQKI